VFDEALPVNRRDGVLIGVLRYKEFSLTHLVAFFGPKVFQLANK